VDGLVLEKEGKNPDGRDVAVKPIGDKEKKLDDRSNHFTSNCLLPSVSPTNSRL
jgi:hypothetical protein